MVRERSGGAPERKYPHGERVRSLRERAGLSQDRLAKKADVSVKQLQNIEAGRNTSLRTLSQIAVALGCDIEELTGREILRQVTPYETTASYRTLIDALEQILETDRAEIIRHATWSAQRLQGERQARGPFYADTNIVAFPQASSIRDSPSVIRDAPIDNGDFPPPPVPFDEWIEKDTDVPRALHAWIRPIDSEAAAGVPRVEDDWLIPTTQLLNSLREIRDDRVKVVKVFGDSMYPVLRNGWKVLLDPAKHLFQPGKIVIVYLREEGTTIGLLAKDGDAFKIVKRNQNYGGPVEIPLRAGEWYPVGTVTTIVEAPVEIE
jgi:transcriptional regulator with XRE-family HTH domain